MLSYQYRDPHVKDKMVLNHPIFNMPHTGKDSLYIEMHPGKQSSPLTIWMNSFIKFLFIIDFQFSFSEWISKRYAYEILQYPNG